jgi:ankyrin repeat protein
LTALHYAVHCDELEVVQLLLAADSDITAQAEFPDLDWGTVNAGDTVMHIAATKGNIDCIQILLRAYVSFGWLVQQGCLAAIQALNQCYAMHAC